MENKTNAELKERLENILNHPPEEIWENIEKKISSEGKEIYNLEVIAPEVCWENIKANLNKVGQKKSSSPLLNLTQWVRYAAVVIGITTLATFALNPNMRNAFINGLSSSNIKASLPEKPYQINKNTLLKDSSKLKKPLSSPIENQTRTEK